MIDSKAIRKRTEREHFFTHEVTALMPPVRREIILAGDFNAIIDEYDNRSQNNIQGLAIKKPDCFYYSFPVTSMTKRMVGH